MDAPKKGDAKMGVENGEINDESSIPPHVFATKLQKLPAVKHPLPDTYIRIFVCASGAARKQIRG